MNKISSVPSFVDFKFLNFAIQKVYFWKWLQFQCPFLFDPRFNCTDVSVSILIPSRESTYQYGTIIWGGKIYKKILS